MAGPEPRGPHPAATLTGRQRGEEPEREATTGKATRSLPTPPLVLRPLDRLPLPGLLPRGRHARSVSATHAVCPLPRCHTPARCAHPWLALPTRTWFSLSLWLSRHCGGHLSPAEDISDRWQRGGQCPFLPHPAKSWHLLTHRTKRSRIDQEEQGLIPEARNMEIKRKKKNIQQTTKRSNGLSYSNENEAQSLRTSPRTCCPAPPKGSVAFKKEKKRI